MSEKEGRVKPMIRKRFWWFGVLLVLLSGCTFKSTEEFQAFQLPTLTSQSPNQISPNTVNPLYLPLVFRSEKTETESAADAPSAPIPVATATDTLGSTPEPVNCVPPNGRNDWVLYTIQYGDTLSALAKRSGTTVPEIQQANCLQGSLIFAGKMLYLPAAIYNAQPDIITISETPKPPPATSLPTNTIEIPQPPPATALPTTTVEPPPPVGPGDPTLHITPYSGPIGTLYTIILTEFASDDPITLSFYHFDTQQLILTQTVVVSYEGNGVAEFVSQADYPTGLYSVEASGPRSGNPVYGSFQVGE